MLLRSSTVPGHILNSYMDRSLEGYISSVEFVPVDVETVFIDSIENF